MGNLLNSISLFIARRTDAGRQAKTTQATVVVSTDQPCPPQITSVPSQPDEPGSLHASHPQSAMSRPGAGERFEPYRDDSAQASDRQLPLVAYPVLRDDPAPSKLRRSRALNLLRTSTSVAMTSRAMPTTQTYTPRQHDSHLATLTLTETERVRLQVMQVQIRLTSLALYEGPIDGTLNPETVIGVRHFQTLKGMRATGTLAAGTLSALGVPPIA